MVCSWYCGTDRTFDDETILIQHQRTKHFQCPTCHKKLTTATALKTHCLYVHKEEINRVPNARDGRDAFDFDIVGMDGVAAAEEAAEIAADPSKRQKTGPAAPSAAAPPAPGATVSVAQPYAQIAQQMAAQMGIPQPGMPFGAIPGMPGVPMPYPGMMQQNQWQQQRPPQPPQPPNPYGQPQPPPNPYGQQPPNPYQQQPPQPMGYPNYGAPQSQSVSHYPPPSLRRRSTDSRKRLTDSRSSHTASQSPRATALRRRPALRCRPARRSTVCNKSRGVPLRSFPTRPRIIKSTWYLMTANCPWRKRCVALHS